MSTSSGAAFNSPRHNTPSDTLQAVVYLSAFCPYCHFAKRLLRQQGLDFIEISVDFNASRREEMAFRSGRETVPQIFIGQAHVGGYDDLSALVASGALPALLEKERPKTPTCGEDPLEKG
ncbi:MAG: glutaredoxin 3 [Halothiobacillus sp.]